MKRILYLFALMTAIMLTGSPQSHAQTVAVSGYVTDSVTGTPLEGANIYIGKDKFGETADSKGYFKFSVQKGRSVSFSVSFVGYDTRTVSLTATEDTILRIALAQDNRLPDIKVYASRRDFGAKSSQMSAIDVPIDQVKALPAVFGEVDVMKALQKLPGVQPAGEGKSGFLVRGGKYDENLIMLDGSTLYNAEHLKGFVSALNPDMIERISFYKGAFPARYGARLSSILDIGLKEGDFEKYHGLASVGLLSSRVQVEGPIRKGTTSFNIAARASYFDAIVQPALKDLYDKPEAMRPYTDMNYYDIGAKITHRFSDRDKISAVFYWGKDVNDNAPSSNKGKYDGNKQIQDENGAFHILKVYYNKSRSTSTDNNWGNLVSSLFWTHSFNERFSVNTNLSYSSYDYKLKMGTNVHNKTTISELETMYRGKLLDFYEEENYAQYNSGITDGALTIDFNLRQSDRHNIRWGTKFSLQELSPTVDVYRYRYSKNLNTSTMEYSEINQSVDTTLGHNQDLRTLSLYLEDDWSICRRLKADIGVRYAFYSVKGKTYHSIEPRLSLRYLLTGDMSLKLSYTRMSQGIHLLSSSNLIMPSDLWVPATKDIPLMKGDQFAAGFSYDFGRSITASVEGYYKLTDNTLDYKEGSSYMSATGDWESKVAVGKGKSYGVEFLLQKKTGKTNGWVSYTWAKSLRKYDKPGQIISNGETFYDGNDRRNTINVYVSHRFNEHWEITASWSYMTGRRGVVSTTAMYGGQINEYEGYFDADDEHRGNVILPIDKVGDPFFYKFGRYMTFTERNGYKLPDSHHLDIGFNYSAKIGKPELILGLTIYNVYNRMNVSNVYTGYDYTGVTSNLKLRGLCMFPFMPSLNLTVKF